VATAVAMLSGIATWGTLHGFGPFARNAQNESLLLLQTFMAVTALTTLALAAVVSERRAAEKRLRRLTVSDPLTGLGNYRRLIAALEGEIGRSQRTERPFASCSWTSMASRGSTTTTAISSATVRCAGSPMP